MKKILFVFIVLLAIHQNVFSQDSEKKVTIQTSPLLLFSDLIIGNRDDTLIIASLEGQFKITNYSNVSITLSFLYNDRTVDGSTDKETYYQIGFKPMYIHRPFETGLKGFFIGVYPNIGFRYVPTDPDRKLYTEIGFGLDLGHKWVFNSGFTMQIGGGVGKTFSIPSRSYQGSYINSDGRITVVRTDISILDFKIGYSF